MKNLKNLSVVISILGLIIMVVTFIKTDNIKNVVGGLLVVSIGSFLNAYANKQLKDKNGVE